MNDPHKVMNAAMRIVDESSLTPSQKMALRIEIGRISSEDISKMKDKNPQIIVEREFDLPQIPATISEGERGKLLDTNYTDYEWKALVEFTVSPVTNIAYQANAADTETKRPRYLLPHAWWIPMKYIAIYKE